MHPVWHRNSIRVFFALGFGLPWLGWTLNLLLPTEPPLRTILFYTGDFMTIGGIVATWAAGGGAAVRAHFPALLCAGGSRLVDRGPPAAAGVAHRGPPGIWDDSPRYRRARHRRTFTFLCDSRLARVDHWSARRRVRLARILPASPAHRLQAAGGDADPGVSGPSGITRSMPEAPSPACRAHRRSRSASSAFRSS